MSNRRFIDKKSGSLVRCLAIGIFLLAGILITQVVLLVRNAINYSSKDDAQKVTHSALTITSGCFVEGREENGTFQFLGLPYALPPVGPRRWRKSQLHHDLNECWNGTYSAIKKKQSCWQFYRNGSYDGSEDCLYLNVITPTLRPQGAPLHVVIFLGGENLNGGEEEEELLPAPPTITARNFVFVSVSIRRSVLGFLSLDLLSKRSSSRASGNYGVSDFLSALRWVRLNIGHFGGDGNNVTVFAYQSGSTILAPLLLQQQQQQQQQQRGNALDGLFQKVWMSGGLVGKEPTSLQQAHQDNLHFLEHTECGEDVQCLVSLSPEALMESVPFGWKKFYHGLPSRREKEVEREHNWLIYDGDLLQSPEDLEHLFPDPPHPPPPPPPIPIVLGSTMHSAELSQEIRATLDWNNTEHYKQYEDKNRSSSEQLSALLTDFWEICPLFSLSLGRVQYRYVITHRVPTPTGEFAKRGLDVESIFGRFTPSSYKDSKFVENISNLFFYFLQTGNVSKSSVETGGYPPGKYLLVSDKVTGLQSYSNCERWDKDDS